MEKLLGADHPFVLWLAGLHPILPDVTGNILEETGYYIAFTLAAFFAIWWLFEPNLRARKIRKSTPPAKQMIWEFLFSIRAVVIFISTGVIIFDVIGVQTPFFYRQWDLYGEAYWYLSVLLGVIWHDTYFYWMHRLYHTKAFYKISHLRHHRSQNPTPFTAYSFSLIEATTEYGFIPLMSCLFPVSGSAIFWVIMIMLAKNVTAHCGYELFPKGATRHWFWGHFTTVTHHDMHHGNGGGNYGLYFIWWDRLMGTEHKNYHARFDTVTTRGERKLDNGAVTA